MPTETVADGTSSYVEAIGKALRDALREDPAVYIMGQDVGAFGGAFKITQGFQEEFGAERVFNTPIAESGTVGIAVGAALLRRRPVVEMQFADFISCGFNQMVNIAAKLHYRMERPVPLVVRLPSGGGVGAGPFHSQNMEAWFGHTPGLKIVAPAFATDAYVLLREAIRDPNPVLFFEHKYLYRRDRGVIDDTLAASVGDRVEGRARVLREGEDVSVITYGWMVHRALEAAEALAAEGVEAEVIDLRTLVPMDTATVIESARKTSKVVVVHEATRTCGFGAEIAARIAEEALEDLDGPIRRVTYPDAPVPYRRSLEDASLPSVDAIATAIRELAAY